MNDNYKILGINEDATESEIKEAYILLKAKYSEDRFLEGEAGNIAAKKLTEIENAYAEIMNERNQDYKAKTNEKLFEQIETAIKNGDLQEAQNLLDSFDQRGAEWHYLQSVVFFKKNWVNESKKQLEIACQMDSDNNKYKEALEKLNARINESGSYKGKQSEYTSQGPDSEEVPQMGGNGCLAWCCEMAICNACLNCLCNCR